MWRYLPGVSQPSKRKRNDDDEEDEVRPQRTPSKRKFSEKWRFGDNGAERDWLKYDDDAKLMSCSVCRQYAKDNNSFVSGCKSMKLESIREHERSKCHIRCVSISRTQSEPLLASATVTALTAMSKQTSTKMKILFRTAHAIGKKARPFSDFEWMCE